MKAKTTATTTQELQAMVARPGDNAISVGLVDGQSFALAQRIATMLASSDIVPKRYYGQIGNCVIALNIAARIKADPLMVMQNLYVVYGTPAWSAQFLIACFNQCGRFSAIRYEFSGKEVTDSWGCRAWAIEKETGERLNGTTITIEMAKKEKWYDKDGSKWKTMPQQMLMYRAAAWFVRAYAPEIAMGFSTEDEIKDTYELEKEGDAYTVKDLRESVAATTATATTMDKTTDTSQASEGPLDLIHCNRDDAEVSIVKMCLTCRDNGDCPEYRPHKG